jgi:thioredoxin:protein disulfide reductase
MNWIKRTALILAVVFAAGCSQKPQVEWTSYTPEKMEQAKASGEPVLTYFYAAWCHPCVMLREQTFTDPHVIAALEPYHRLKFDMSFIRSPKIQKISRTYQVKGMPTLILFGPDGKEFFHRSGFIDAAQLLQVLQDFRSAYDLPEPAPPAVN